MKGRKIILGIMAALVIAVFISPLASNSPDGLERVAEDKGFIEKVENHEIVKSPMPDYVIPGMSNETVAGSAAGFIGTVITFGLMYGIGRIISKRRSTANPKV